MFFLKKESWHFKWISRWFTWNVKTFSRKKKQTECRLLQVLRFKGEIFEGIHIFFLFPHENICCGVCFIRIVCPFQQSFSHIMTASACGRELYAHYMFWVHIRSTSVFLFEKEAYLELWLKLFFFFFFWWGGGGGGGKGVGGYGPAIKVMSSQLVYLSTLLLR